MPNHPLRTTTAATLTLLACSLVTLLPATARADPVPACQIFTSQPADGATSVPLDVVVTGEAWCNVLPALTDDTGQTIAGELTSDGAKFQLKPQTPLLPDRTYTVALAAPGVCAALPDRIRFRTGGSPGVREVRFVTLGKAIHAIDVHLSEPVLVPADLAEGSTRVSVTIDGFSLTPVLQSLTGGAAFQAYYKNLPQQPALAGKVHVRLHEGLRFASGKDLQEDVVLTLDVPGHLRYGVWRSMSSPEPCPEMGVFAGCSAAPAGHGGGWAWLLGLGVAAVGVGRRRFAQARCRP